MKGVARCPTEAVSEYTEQVLTNFRIRKGAGEIVGMTEGALNALIMVLLFNQVMFFNYTRCPNKSTRSNGSMGYVCNGW